MAEGSDRGFTPSEELMWGKALCTDCAAIARDDAQAWARDHVAETGHKVELTLGYDLRPVGWGKAIDGYPGWHVH